MKKIALLLIAAMVVAGASFAAFDKKVVFKGKTQGDITFDHGKHLAQKVVKLVCKDCHPAIFKMKAGTSKVTMAEIGKGKFCGVCHAAKQKAFAVAKETCVKCHVPAAKPKA